MQRLEAEATMDEIAINPELDELLNRKLDQRKFIAWRDGKTGWPFFDACMRYLTATGWINFRMRAMLHRRILHSMAALASHRFPFGQFIHGLRARIHWSQCRCNQE